MQANEFIKKWQILINYLGLPAVGIHVGWQKIKLDSKVEQFNSSKAWEKLYSLTPPWFKKPRTFKQLIEDNDIDYKSEILKEISNGKMQRFATQGLGDPKFCAFANRDGSFILLGDGNHRFLDCDFLLNLGKNFTGSIKNTEIDIIYLENFEEVMEPKEKIWGANYELLGQSNLDNTGQKA